MVFKLILASSSPYRAKILSDAGLQFTVKKASFDERSVEKQLQNATAKEVAQFLAEAKALDCAKKISDETLSASETVIIGCDQTLEFQGEILHKAKSLAEARARLQQMAQKIHFLHSGISLVQKDEIIWSTTETVSLTMRRLSEDFLDQYLKNNGEKLLGSVGCYQIEGEGIQLFDAINGDFFSIIGLPLLPLLKELRKLGVLNV